jgi:hypothetical protein
MLEFISGYTDNYFLDIFLLLNFWCFSPFSVILVYCLWINHQYHTYRRDIISALVYLGYVVFNLLLFLFGKNKAFLYFVPIEINFPDLILNIYRYTIYVITTIVYLVHIYKKINANYSIAGDNLFLTKERNLKIRFPLYIACILTNATMCTIFLYKNWIMECIEIIPELLIWVLIVSQIGVLAVILYTMTKNLELEIYSEQKISKYEKEIKDKFCFHDKICHSDYVSDITTYLICGVLIAYIYLNAWIVMVSLLYLFESSRNYFLYFLVGFISVKIVNMVKNYLLPCVDLCLRPEIFILYDSFCLISGINFAFRLQEILERVLIIMVTAPLISLDCNSYCLTSYQRAYYGYYNYEHKFIDEEIAQL